MLQILIDNGADLDIKDKYGESPRDIVNELRRIKDKRSKEEVNVAFYNNFMTIIANNQKL